MITWGDSKKDLEDLGWTPYQEALRWRRRCILAWIILAVAVILWRVL